MALLCKRFLCTARPMFGKASSSPQEALGSAGLYDPRWHPKIVIRGKTLGKNLQDNVDYYVSSQPARFC